MDTKEDIIQEAMEDFGSMCGAGTCGNSDCDTCVEAFAVAIIEAAIDAAEEL